MPRHHNRALLSEITEKQLDPTKEYVVGKNGLTLSPRELKKETKQGPIVEAIAEKEPEVSLHVSKEKEETPEQVSTLESNFKVEESKQEDILIQEDSLDTQKIDIKTDSTNEKDLKTKKKVIKK